MQNAVDVVMHSEHATSKVAASIFDNTGASFASISLRPALLKAHFAWDAKLGKSSQFIHAELAAILGFNGVLAGASVCITDPFCPNCAKIMAEAGVRNIFIDHKGFEKDFITRNAGEFEHMSMVIAQKSGMNVYMVNRKAGDVTPLLLHSLEARPNIGGYELFDVPDGCSFDEAFLATRERLGCHEAWVMAFVHDTQGKQRGIVMFESLPPGMTPHDFMERANGHSGKYRYPTDPLIRLFIGCRRMGLFVQGGMVASAHIPSSRALVNAVGFGLSHLVLGSDTVDHDEEARVAIQILGDKQIMNVRFV